MPQDSLNVTASTSFQIAPTLQGLPRTSVGVYTGYFGSYNVVNQPADFYTVLSWPFQAIVNTDSSDPAVLVGAPPPAGVNYVDATLLYRYSGPDPQGLPDYLVPVRIYPLNSNPITTDNTENFDASQLRGSFSFQVEQPDYAAAEALVAGFGYRSALPIETFGQTTVVLSKVNPQLSVNITGTTPIGAADYNNLNAYLSYGGGSVIHYAGTQVTVGTGLLADVQGNVAVHQSWLKDVDDRQGTVANNLTLTSTTLTGWSTPAATHPTLTLDTLQGDVVLSGSTVDQFDVEGTPDSAPRVTIRNFATSGPAAGVYVMGKSVMPLYVTGNFAVYVGRRLNADGFVTNVGQVDGVYDYHNMFNPYDAGFSNQFVTQHLFENFQLFNPSGAVLVPGTIYDYYLANYIYQGQQPLPVFFNYTGAGQSTLVFDTSHDVMNQVGNQVHWGTMTFSPFDELHRRCRQRQLPWSGRLAVLSRGRAVRGQYRHVFLRTAVDRQFEFPGQTRSVGADRQSIAQSGALHRRRAQCDRCRRDPHRRGAGAGDCRGSWAGNFGRVEPAVFAPDQRPDIVAHCRGAF